MDFEISSKTPHAGEDILDFDQSELQSSLKARFESVVRRLPAQTAMIDGIRSLTYSDLNRDANRLANYLLAQGERGGGIVGFLLEHGASQIVAMLGILKAGKAYLPLDPGSPPSRLAFMLNDTEAGIIVSNDRYLALAMELAGNACQIINLDQMPPDTDADNPDLAIPPTAMAGIYYTSGSTGRPKGVIKDHRDFLHFARTLNRSWSIRTNDRIAHTTSCSFAAALITTLNTLLNGATLLPFDVKLRGSSALGSWMVAEKITVFFTVPSMFRNFVEALAGKEADFGALRLVLLGGETLHQKEVELFDRHFPKGCQLLNILGLTEALLIRQFPVDRKAEYPGDLVPVGYSFEDKDLLLLGDDGSPVGPGEVGEIVVKSLYLSPGYWRQPELTRSVFLPDPSGSPARLYKTGDLGRLLAGDCLVHLGRKDGMVKIRGQRVELGEIEYRLGRVEGVKEAVVLARENMRNIKRLVAYVVPSGQPSPSAAELRAALTKVLPEYMVPVQYVFLQALPLNPHGKVDRLALPDPAKARPELNTPFIGPRNEMERRLAGICEEILEIRPVGVSDDFFDLGGDSLAFLQLCTEIEEEFGESLSMEAVLQTPTIEHLGSLLGQEDAESSRREKTDRPRPAGRLRLVPAYRIGAPLLAWCCTRRWVQTLFFGRPVRLMRQCLAASSELASNGAAEAIPRSLASNTCLGWRCVSLARCTVEEFDRWVSVSGFPTFLEAYRQGRGIVLITGHSPLARLIALVLHRAGIAHQMTVGRPSRVQASMGLPDVLRNSLYGMDIADQALFAGQLFKGRQILESGGVVHIVADGFQGGSEGITLPFFGRARVFKTGFAELAVTADAAVVPVLASLDVNGRVDLRFLEPLHTNGPDRAAQVESLVVQFAEILRRQWREDIGNITWWHLRRFRRLPPIAE